MTAAILDQVLLFGAGVGAISLIALLVRPLARHDPVLRYRLTLAALAAALALPPALVAGALLGRAAPDVAPLKITLDGCHEHPTATAIAALPPMQTPPALSSTQPSAPRTLSIPPEILLAAYSAGVLAVLGVTVFRVGRAARIVRRARAVTDPGAAAIAAALAADLGIRRRIALLESAEVMAPACWSLRRSAIILPPGAAQSLGPAALRCVLHHELIHVRRRESLIGLAHALVAALAWFQPLVWVLGRMLARDAEASCDALVVRATRSPRTYAHALLAACRFAVPTPAPFAALGSAHRIRRRIAMLKFAQHPAGRVRTISLGAAALAALGVVLSASAGIGAGVAPAEGRAGSARVEIHAPPGVRNLRRMSTPRPWLFASGSAFGAPAGPQHGPWLLQPVVEAPSNTAFGETETVLWAKETTVRGNTITASTFTFALPEGSSLQAICEAERIDLAPEASGTRVALHAGAVRVIDEGGVERLTMRPARAGHRLALTGTLRAGKFQFDITATDERDQVAPVVAVYDAAAGIPEGEQEAPPGSVRWDFHPETDGEPLRLEMRWRYLEGC